MSPYPWFTAFHRIISKSLFMLSRLIQIMKNVSVE